MSKKKETAVAKPEFSGAGLQKLTPDQMAAHLSGDREGWSDFEELAILEAGDVLQGQFLGRGPMHEMADKVSGEIREIGTYRVKPGDGITYRVLASHQIDAELGALVDESGAPVRPMLVQVLHLGQVDTKNGRRVNNIKISTKPL